MAVVNVDLSEYDAIRKRNSELEEQVKELKKLNDDADDFDPEIDVLVL